MSDFPTKNTDPFSNSPNAPPLAGRDVQQDLGNLAQSSVEAAQHQASQIGDAAKTAGDRIQEKTNEQKDAGADTIGRFADAMSRAASEFDSEIPIVARFIRTAASQMEGASDAVRAGNFNDLVQSAQSFARRQPTVFLGFAVLAGFGVVRFLKSSSTGGGDAVRPSRFEGGQPSP